MLFKDFDPLKEQMLKVLGEDGQILNAKLDPKLDKETLLKMYRTFLLTRLADQRALNYQRQGRMLTFPPTRGHEGVQIGAASAMLEKDWLSPYYRDLSVMLYRGIRLDQIFLYWYGNEWGSHFDPSLHTLPVNIIIGSQMTHAAGLAYASKILNKGEVAVATIGDGGTSHGEFYEGINFASTYKAPMVALVVNNQYAISTPRRKATAANTIAQKAYAFGIPGIQVDGNDILAVHVALKAAIDHARSGKGPVLVEAVTYRLTAHTTSDDPTIYRTNEEVEVWEKKEPLIRFRKYLLDQKVITEKEEEALKEELEKEVIEAFNRIEKDLGPVVVDDVFKYTYETMTPELEEQLNEYKKFLEGQGK